MYRAPLTPTMNRWTWKPENIFRVRGDVKHMAHSWGRETYARSVRM